MARPGKYDRSHLKRLRDLTDMVNRAREHPDRDLLFAHPDLLYLQ